MYAKAVLIGGVGCSGKTVLARQIMLRQHIPYISIDHLMMGLYRSNLGFSVNPEDCAESLSHVLWPIVDGMLKTNLENDHSIVFEGFQLLPKDMASIDASYKDRCICLCLGLAESYIEREFLNKIRDHRCAVEQRSFAEENIEQLIAANKSQRLQCQRHGIPFFEVDDNFSLCLAQALSHIEQRISDSS